MNQVGFLMIDICLFWIYLYLLEGEFKFKCV